MKKTLLWLDDCRNPFDTQVDWLAFSPIGRNVDVVWVQYVDEFFDYIDKNGLPDARTGYDCAKYVVDYCMKHDLDIPAYNIQSSNPVGKENIQRLMDNYHKYYIKTH